MKVYDLVVLLSSLLGSLWVKVKCHGRLLEPPSRASMWRLGYRAPINYNDNQLFCGGFYVQYGVNGGRCGVCGDPWNGRREHESGGTFANGVIVRKYKVGQIINATVELTANHRGFFEFRLCPTDNPFERISHTCLRKFPLIIADRSKSSSYHSGAEDYTRFHVPSSSGGRGYKAAKITIPLRLPEGIKCRACLFQWQYTAGNSWGVQPDGRQCIGCGDQEQFYGCADIAVGYDDLVLGKPATRHPWYFQSESDKKTWHYGVVRYTEPDSHSEASTIQLKLFSCLFFEKWKSLPNFSTVFVTSLVPFVFMLS